MNLSKKIFITETLLAGKSWERGLIHKKTFQPPGAVGDVTSDQES